MDDDATPGALRFNDELGPVGKKMTTEEYHRTDGKAGAFLWWSEIPNGAFLFTEKQVQARVAAERQRWAGLVHERLAGTVMSKYASSAECAAARDALRNALADGLGA